MLSYCEISVFVKHKCYLIIQSRGNTNSGPWNTKFSCLTAESRNERYHYKVLHINLTLFLASASNRNDENEHYYYFIPLHGHDQC